MKTYHVILGTLAGLLFAPEYLPPFALLAVAVVFLVLKLVDKIETHWVGIFAPVWVPVLFSAVLTKILAVFVPALIPLIQAIAHAAVPQV